MDSLVKIAARDLNVADNSLCWQVAYAAGQTFVWFMTLPKTKWSSCLIIPIISSGFIIFIKVNFWFWRDFLCAASALWTTITNWDISVILVWKGPACMTAFPLKKRQLSITYEIWGIKRLPKKSAPNPYPLRTMLCEITRILPTEPTFLVQLNSWALSLLAPTKQHLVVKMDI